MMLAGGTPEGFVDIEKEIEGVVIEARYAGTDNFLGRPVDGYKANKAVISVEAAAKLKLVQAELAEKGLGLKVFDAYRPQRAVDHFMRWIDDKADTTAKDAYYPDVSKKQLVPEGYIAEKSGHSRGSTIDLTIIRLADGSELDMGSPWDFFGPVSHALNDSIPVEAQQNRLLLRTLMLKHGFAPYEYEWWHFTLKDEPHKDTYFDFVIE